MVLSMVVEKPIVFKENFERDLSDFLNVHHTEIVFHVKKTPAYRASMYYHLSLCKVK